MKLWLLEIVGCIDYDWCDGFVVRAKNEVEARRQASEAAGAEGPGTWTDPRHSSCKELIKKGHAGIVLQSFNAG